MQTLFRNFYILENDYLCNFVHVGRTRCLRCVPFVVKDVFLWADSHHRLALL